jgi:hypothetical protein
MNYTKMQWGIYSTNHKGVELKVSTDKTGEGIAYFMKPLCHEDEGNIRLIMSAPELYEALKNLVERNLIKDTNGDHYDEVLDALAKAEGKE